MPKLKIIDQAPDLPKLEEEILNWWKKNKIFEKSVSSKPTKKTYIFYDGPPFATGMPHYGHLLGSTAKDVIPRYWTMKGYRVKRVWGWDCHGLPIEHMIENNLRIKGGKTGIENFSIDKFNNACRSEVLRLDKAWEKIISRLGRWVDFKNNYQTMDRNYMESVWWGFSQLHQQGLVYEGKKVILYCPRCSTPLSNFEIAMDNSYKKVTDFATTYKYKLKNSPNTYLLAWSTTPWNKLATPALAVNAKLEYSKIKQNNEFYFIASSRLEKILINHPYTVTETLKGEALTKFQFEPHYDFYPHRKADEKIGVVVADDFVTADEGTGVVTLAVYGEDDFRVMKKASVQLIEHVDEEGKLKTEVKPWAGMDILKANPLINQDLTVRGLIYNNYKHTHSVATCYRCATRLYYAPIPAWFINVQKIKNKLITQNEKINWYPSYLKHGRFLHGLKNAPDWNISRSRYWGTPMPIWQATKNGKKIIRIIGSIKELKQWAVYPNQVKNITDIHREFLDKIEVWVDDQKTIKGSRIPEVFDCWVESGSMPFASIHYPFKNKAKFEKNYPAQFVSEYIAQTRAWFYTMHVISVGIFGKPPFENVLTTGTILAEDGSKMSKSRKNYPDPMILINKYGVDSLRLYLMSSPVMKAENINFSEKEVSDIRRKVIIIWWNIFKFYKLFSHKQVDVTQPPLQADHILDQWLLSRINSLTQAVTQYLDNYDLINTSRILIDFINELSTWYLRLSRDRLRQEDNLQASQVFGYTLYILIKLMSPLTPFFSEILHRNLVDENTSIHLTDWPQSDHKIINHHLNQNMVITQHIVNLARASRIESGIKLRQPLQQLIVTLNQTRLDPALNKLIKAELNVKKIKIITGSEIIIKLDTHLTNELKAEGEAREIMRSIQKLRKQAGLKIKDKSTITLPNWPKNWKKQIEIKTNTNIVQGENISLN